MKCCCFTVCTGRVASRMKRILWDMGVSLYFWSFIVALLIFAVGAGVSFYEGIVHLQNPEPMQRPIINYIVLGLSLVFEGASWWVAVRSMRVEKGAHSYLRAIIDSKDPPKFMVLLEDSAALSGILIALAATWASVTFHEPRFDGVGSLLIGVVLAAVAIFLAKESKDLLIGERADPAMQQGIVGIAEGMDGVLRVNGLLTTHMAPTDVVAALSLEFEDRLTITQVERIVADMEAAIRRQHSEITSLFVKPQTPQMHKAAIERIEKGPDV